MEFYISTCAIMTILICLITPSSVTATTETTDATASTTAGTDSTFSEDTVTTTASTESTSLSEDTATITASTESTSLSEDTKTTTASTESTSLSEDTTTTTASTESTSLSEDTTTTTVSTESTSLSEDTATPTEGTESTSVSEDTTTSMTTVLKIPTNGPSVSGLTTVNLREDVRMYTELGTISCYHQNRGCQTCNIVSVSPTFSGFDLRKGGGSLDFHLYYVPYLPNSNLNYSSVQTYYVNISCVNNDQRTAWMVEVDIQPNLPPVFSVYPLDTLEIDAKSTGENTIIYRPNVTDAENDPFVFSWNMHPNTDLFTVRGTDGTISTSRDLRTATENIFHIQMNVSDGRHTTGPLIVTILLKDLNMPPSCLDFPTTLSIQEDAPQGHPILTLTCTDPDTNDHPQPVMTVDPVAETWKFDFQDNKLKLKGSYGNNLLDAESVQFYRICFRVSDGFLEAENLCVGINVINVNESPRCNSNSYSCLLYETSVSSPSTYCNLANFGISDPENDPVTNISIVSSSLSHFLSWEYQRSRLTLDGLYDIDGGSLSTTFTIELLAVDNGGATATCTVHVSVLDRNDNTPEISGSVIYVISPDTTSVPSTLGTLVITDRDLTAPNNEVTLALKSMFPVIGSSYIRLEQNHIRYIRRIDPSVIGSTLIMEIEAIDRGLPPRSSSVTVYIKVQLTPPSTTTPALTTTSSTTTTHASTTTSEEQKRDQVDETAEKDGLLSSSVGVALVAAVIAVSAVFLLTVGFFVFRYLTTGSCPISPSNGYSSNHSSHIHGNSNTRIGHYDGGYQQSRHQHMHEQYTQYNDHHSQDNIRWQGNSAIRLT